MSLIESANLGFSEDEFVEVFEKLWKKVVFEYKKAEKEIVMINSGDWGANGKNEYCQRF